MTETNETDGFVRMSHEVKITDPRHPGYVMTESREIESEAFWYTMKFPDPNLRGSMTVISYDRVELEILGDIFIYLVNSLLAKEVGCIGIEFVFNAQEARGNG